MTELNGCEPKKVKILGPYTFSIGDTTSYGGYVRGGVVTQVKMPQKVSFVSSFLAKSDFLNLSLSLSLSFRKSFPSHWLNRNSS